MAKFKNLKTGAVLEAKSELVTKQFEAHPDLYVPADKADKTKADKADKTKEVSGDEDNKTEA